MDSIFLQVLTSYCYNVLQVLQTRALQSFNPDILARRSLLQALQTLDVLYSSIVTTMRSPAASLHFNARQKAPVTPHLSPFSFIKSFPNIPALKATRGTFSLSIWNFAGFHFWLL
ncbi:uncharacterized protein RHIMIDRAFT_125606 [Rhizopus microsporus ATCC 52813]|uniref:Uncharacterized protein n=1 Tax=Rhizopus microsporus ATCC 52813 TaxID=1340429 RepID=A0A2G4SWW5_RHIZD|nr:uncharacterized protein RHIMIDRAFT_125606 [Rhizopus microsporus ATCC 52813]PHZ12856.1 hypothetical protein RHIMIDRAFT_125606 [Rhizopus microsporus ATCC 52813]